jgi:hypothetical protein
VCSIKRVEQNEEKEKAEEKEKEGSDSVCGDVEGLGF